MYTPTRSRPTPSDSKKIFLALYGGWIPLWFILYFLFSSTYVVYMDSKLWEQRIWIEKMGRSKKKEKTKPKGKKKGSISDQIENRYR